MHSIPVPAGSLVAVCRCPERVAFFIFIYPGEVTFGGYRVHQSIEAGYRISDVTGSGGMFDTLVNEHAGLRLFEQTFSMRSDTAAGQPFDDLFVNSVGWGGDPNNFLRMRVSKNQWYDFRASFRRDQNFSDFNLLANPLNPASSSRQ